MRRLEVLAGVMASARRHENRRSQNTNCAINAGCRLRLALRVASVVVALTIYFATSTRSFAAETGRNAAFTVLVFNFRQVPGGILAKAETAAGRNFEHSDVHVTWQDCGAANEPCHKGAGRVFLLAVMAGPVQNEFVDTISGRSVVADHLAAVYYDYLPRVPRGAAGTSDIATILGCVIAHELGHLLLGTHGHSITGIMKASWDSEQTRRALMSQLSFLPEEGALLRAALREGTQPREAESSTLVSRPRS